MLYCPKCKMVSYGQSVICPRCKEIMVEISEEDLGNGVKKESRETESERSGGLLPWGILSLIIGVVGYFLSAPKMDVIRSGFGMLAAGLSESTAKEMTMWQYAYYGSIVLIVLGGLLFIAGIIQHVKK